MISNAREAKEIVAYCKNRHMDFINCRYSEADFRGAENYLACLRGPEMIEFIKALEWANSLLEKFQIDFGHDGKHQGIGSIDCPIASHHHHDSYCENKIEKALALYREVVKEKA